MPEKTIAELIGELPKPIGPVPPVHTVGAGLIGPMTAEVEAACEGLRARLGFSSWALPKSGEDILADIVSMAEELSDAAPAFAGDAKRVTEQIMRTAKATGTDPAAVLRVYLEHPPPSLEVVVPPLQFEDPLIGFKASEMLIVTKSVARTVATRPDGLAVRSAAHPQFVPAVCDRCAKPQDVLSGPPNSEVVRLVECRCCGHKWNCTVQRGPLGGEGE